MQRLSGKVAVVSGGGAGIGAATALAFAREGAIVAVLDIDAESGKASAKAILDAGGLALFINTDVTQEASVEAAIAQTVVAFGAVNIAFNCAGGSSHSDSLVTDLPLAQWATTMDLNLLSTILVSRFCVPEIIKAGGGTVVNMSSGAALRGSSPKHIYSASKGAIVSLTRAMAGAYARQNVRVNAICSGRVLTERILSTLGKPGEAGPVVDRQDATGRVSEYPFWVGVPEDIAHIAVFLASEESRMITGASIPADGGRSAY